MESLAEDRSLVVFSWQLHMAEMARTDIIEFHDVRWSNSPEGKTRLPFHQRWAQLTEKLASISDNPLTKPLNRFSNYRKLTITANR